jgi:hypothetical protein
VPIFLSVKGPCASVRRAGARRGIPVSKCSSYKGHALTKGMTHTKAEAPCTALSKVMRWYGEREGVRTGRGFPPGALLFFNQGGCGGTSLRGVPRRRRRRRR